MGEPEGKVRALIIGEAGEAVKAVWGDALSASAPVYGGGGGGGGFKMDPQELQTVIGLWQDQLKLVIADGQKIDMVVSLLRPPGKDPASGGFVSSGLGSLTALKKQNDSMKQYIEGYIQKLTDAKNATVATDESQRLRSS